MEMKMLFVSARNAVVELCDGGTYHTKETYSIFLNGKYVISTDKVITNLFGLFPDTAYRLEAKPGKCVEDADITGGQAVPDDVQEEAAFPWT